MPVTSHPSPLVDQKRLWEDLMTIAKFTDADEPYTRRSFSPLFKDGRKWLAERFAEAGLVVRTDTAGNLIGRMSGSHLAMGTIMMGSHSDTVPGGGRFDGIAGVIGALEVVRTLTDRGFKPRHNIEVVDFLAEEANDFGISCVGSRGMAGVLETKMLAYTNSAGETLAQAIDSVGGSSKRIGEATRSDVKATFELHIEQGPILEQESIDIGLVTAIVGIRRLEFIFNGEADHAGTTPMHMRRDAAVAAAETIVLARRLADGMALRNEGHFVATTGVVEVQPNAVNVIPKWARLVVEVRGESRPLVEEFSQALDTASTALALSLRVERAPAKIFSDTTPTTCDQSLRVLLKEAAKSLALSTRELASGAGHDSVFLARIAPAAMVFVPCKKGKSHAAEEWAEPVAIAAGASTIAEAIMRLDSQAQG
jgi:beta-ureidopropionase / N-carbamoyl-L-amino-acid hydrolase